MIPKIIHYCWFGANEKPKAIVENIAKWKTLLPDYEIIEWNEHNFDICYNVLTKEAYENKKYAFVSDIARLYALSEKGGIYLDTDVEVLRPFDDLLDREYFFGREYSGVIGTATIGASAQCPIIKEFLQTYEGKVFVKADGSFETVPNVVHLTAFINNNYPELEIFDQYYFSPKHPATRVCHTKDYTYCIHHFDGSWISEEQLKKREKEGKLIRRRELRDKIIGYFVDVEKVKRLYRALKG